MRPEEIPALLEEIRARMREIKEASRRAFEPFILQDAEFGALDAKLPALQAVSLEFAALFDAKDALADARQRLADLGLSHLLETEVFGKLAPVEVEDRVAEAFGIVRCSARTYDSTANEAWFLAAFATAHFRAFGFRNEEYRIVALVEPRPIA